MNALGLAEPQKNEEALAVSKQKSSNPNADGNY